MRSPLQGHSGAGTTRWQREETGGCGRREGRTRQTEPGAQPRNADRQSREHTPQSRHLPPSHEGNFTWNNVVKKSLLLGSLWELVSLHQVCFCPQQRLTPVNPSSTILSLLLQNSVGRLVSQTAWFTHFAQTRGRRRHLFPSSLWAHGCSPPHSEEDKSRGGRAGDTRSLRLRLGGGRGQSSGRGKSPR